MASRHGRRKIAKSKPGKRGRTSNMHEPEEEEIDLDDTTARTLLMSGFTVTKKQPRQRFGLLIGLFLLGCVVVISLAGGLAWTLSKHTDVPENIPPNADKVIGGAHDIKKNDPAYGLSTQAVFNNHQASLLNSTSFKSVANAVNVQDLKRTDLNPLLITRVPDTPGSRAAREHIIGKLTSIGGWDINQHTFQDTTPLGVKSFTNIIATANPSVKRRLVLACHYDSKYFKRHEFIGATDSALPCAQLLYLARSLAEPLRRANATNPPVTLQLIFFDGEEAFKSWTDTDSLYGSRQLAGDMQNTDHPYPGAHTNLLDGMDMFVLLDLLGARNPRFYDYFQSTSVWYNHMRNIEQRLKRSRVWTGSTTNNYFVGGTHYNAGMQDDHIPFLQRNVRILHLIPNPFPNVWHKLSDNAAALDDNTISNLSKIFHIFVAEYLSLPAP
ncbi:glutaminyl-peptide cyclotransferase-like [Lytechinus pictus]|uniref:glutaminyl-peptide cyclotransferase-like n=1 Tax=Lytechinus pictus TaxID=7653 RepID=UPI00240E5E52|nr:glutaminyl-peptide cyclotransferase-like [Lytechinus pictus]